MSSGKLGSANLVAATNTVLYSCPVGKIASINFNLCNRGTADIKIRVAILDGAIGTLVDGDYIEYDETIRPNGVLERTGILLSAGQSLMAYSDIATGSVVVWGWEETE